MSTAPAARPHPRRPAAAPAPAKPAGPALPLVGTGRGVARCMPARPRRSTAGASWSLSRARRHRQDDRGRRLSGAGEAALPVWIGRGQCIEHYGAGEAYLPLLDALGRLGRAPGGEGWWRLRRYAPTWLAQLPGGGRGGAAGRAAPGPGGTPQRMLRELAEALEALTAAQPWCSCWRMCTGVMPRLSRRWPCWRGGGKRRACCCWRPTGRRSCACGSIPCRRCSRS